MNKFYLLCEKVNIKVVSLFYTASFCQKPMKIGVVGVDFSLIEG